MAWLPMALTDGVQRIVKAERESHPEAHVRGRHARSLVVARWRRARAATIAGLGRATVRAVRGRVS